MAKNTNRSMVFFFTLVSLFLIFAMRVAGGSPKHSPRAPVGEGVPKHSPRAPVGEGSPKKRVPIDWVGHAEISGDPDPLPVFSEEGLMEGTSERDSLNRRLEEAQRAGELPVMIRLIQDLNARGWATPLQLEKVWVLENELERERLNVERRWREAQKLFAAGEYAGLRRILNRNPFLGEKTDRTYALWEMALMADFQLRLKDDPLLVKEAQRIAGAFPESFWVPVFFLRRALRSWSFSEAEIWYEKAKAISPLSPVLKWPGAFLKLRNQWARVSWVLDLCLLYFFLRCIFALHIWWKSWYWERIAWLTPRYPRTALKYMESRMGKSRDHDEKKRLFEGLLGVSATLGEEARVERYSGVLLQMAPGHVPALRALADLCVRQQRTDDESQQAILAYAAVQDCDSAWVERAIRYLVNNRLYRHDFIPLVRKYVLSFPDEPAAARFLACLYLQLPADRIGHEGLETLEMAWEICGVEEIWDMTWRVSVISGLKDRAISAFSARVRGGEPLDVRVLMNRLEGDVEAILREIRNGFQEGRENLFRSLDRIENIKYFSESQSSNLLRTLDSYVNSSDKSISERSEKVRYHLKMMPVHWTGFRESLSLAG